MSNSVPDINSVSKGDDELDMPEIVNLYEYVFKRLPQIAERIQDKLSRQYYSALEQ